MAAEFEDWAVNRLMSLSKVELHDHAFREIVHHLHELDEYPMTAAVFRLCGAGGAVATFLAELGLKKKELPTLPILQLTKEYETADLQLSMLPDLKSVAKIKLHDRAFREIIGHLAGLEYLDLAAYLDGLCTGNAEADAFGSKFVGEKKRLRHANRVHIRMKTVMIDLDDDEQSVAIKHEYESDATRQGTDLASSTKQETAPSVDKKPIAFKREPNVAEYVMISISDDDAWAATSCKTPAAEKDLAATTKQSATKHPATSTGKTAATEKDVIATKGDVNTSKGNTAASNGKTVAPTGKIAASTGKTAATEKDIVATKGNTAASKGKTATSKGKTATSKGKAAMSEGKAASPTDKTAATEKDIVANKGQIAESNQDDTVINIARPKSTQISKRALQCGRTHTYLSTEKSPGIEKEATSIGKMPTLIKRQPNASCEEPWTPSDSDDEPQLAVSMMKMLPDPSNKPNPQTKQVSTRPQFSDTDTVSLLLGTDVTSEYIKQYEGDRSVTLIKFEDDGVVALGYTMAIEWTTDTRQEVRRMVFFAQHPEYVIYGPSLEEARAMDKAYNRVYALLGYERHPNHPKFFERMALKQQALTGTKK